MAFARSLVFPLSYVEESPKNPPFLVYHEDADNPRSWKAFSVIRHFLETQNNDQLGSPTPSMGGCSEEHEETWLLQRDITYALILPVLEIYHYATQLAISMLGDRNIFDLELVFRGEARGAFSWLQCSFTEEKEWCSARGCPACVVSCVLQAEPTIQIVLTACQLYELLRRASKKPNYLPVFGFWIFSLRTALDEDPSWGPAWGPGFWIDLEPRAISLEIGIHQMVHQCMDFEDMKIPQGQSGKGPQGQQ